MRYIRHNSRHDYGVHTGSEAQGGRILIVGGATLLQAKDRAQRHVRERKGNTATIIKKIGTYKS